MEHPLSLYAPSPSLYALRARGGGHSLRCGTALAWLSWPGLRHFHTQRNALGTLLKKQKRELIPQTQYAFEAVFTLKE
jgi:hypothetical protein